MFSNIVVPLDGSKCAEEALDVAIALAKAESARLSICSIVDPIVVVGTSPPSPATDLMLTDRENEARRIVETALRKAQSAGVHSTGATHLGVPFDEILRFAKHQRADVIIMGTHGRTGLRRLFLGSVAESVLRESECPVIVVRQHAKVEAPAA